MNVKQFIAQQRRVLRDFETWWIEQRMIDPDAESFPEEMKAADWDEQLASFQDQQDEDSATDEVCEWKN
jgi:hypothetical protein